MRAGCRRWIARPAPGTRRCANKQKKFSKGVTRTIRHTVHVPIIMYEYVLWSQSRFQLTIYRMEVALYPSAIPTCLSVIPCAVRLPQRLCIPRPCPVGSSLGRMATSEGRSLVGV